LGVVKEIGITIGDTFLKEVHLVTHVSANVWSVFGESGGSVSSALEPGDQRQGCHAGRGNAGDFR